MASASSPPAETPKTAVRSTGNAKPKRNRTQSADVLDEERLVRCKSFRVKARRVLVQPQRLVSQAVRTNDHRGRYVSGLEDFGPLRDELTVTGEYDCFGRCRWEVRRDLPATVEIERLGDELSRYRLGASLHRDRHYSWRLPPLAHFGGGDRLGR